MKQTWLTLEQVADWLGCSTNDVLSLAYEGKMTACAETSFYTEKTKEVTRYQGSRCGVLKSSNVVKGSKIEFAKAMYITPQAMLCTLMTEGAVLKINGMTNEDLFGLTSDKLKAFGIFNLGEIILRRDALRISVVTVVRYIKSYLDEGVYL